MNFNFYKFIFLICLALFSVSCVKSQTEELVFKEENQQIYFEKATELIYPYIELTDQKPKTSPNKETDLKTGIKYLDAVTTINPQNFAAFWMKGKAYQALKDSENAYSQFKESYKLNQNNPDVAREFEIECLNLGKGSEGVEAALHALSIKKDVPDYLETWLSHI